MAQAEPGGTRQIVPFAALSASYFAHIGFFNPYLPLWLQHLVNATGDVADTDATVRHLLGHQDAYWRFHPLGDAFGCGLDDARPENLAQLTTAAEAYIDAEAVRLASLVAALVPRAQ